MVQLITASTSAHTATAANPTREEIDAYILSERTSDAGVETLCGIIREIQCKSGAGALLHPAEEYFVEQCFVNCVSYLYFPSDVLSYSYSYSHSHSHSPPYQ